MMRIFRGRSEVEHPRLVAIETTNRCNARCSFCPNDTLDRPRQPMKDDLFEKIIEDCRFFPLKAIEPCLNGEPFVDPRILDRLAYIRRRLPNTKLQLYTNGYGLTPEKIDALAGVRIDHLFISLNTMNPETYLQVMGLELERTLDHLTYLTDSVRRQRVARTITLRMVRSPDTPLSDQQAFVDYGKKLRVRSFVVGMFNYAGAIPSPLPVPSYPCEHITRLDILSNGMATLCCMDIEGKYALGDVRKDSILEIHNGPEAVRYRTAHRSGRRNQVWPCDRCNVFWPSLEKMPPWRTARFAAQAGYYFIRHRPTGRMRTEAMHSLRARFGSSRSPIPETKPIIDSAADRSRDVNGAVKRYGGEYEYLE